MNAIKGCLGNVAKIAQCILADNGCENDAASNVNAIVTNMPNIEAKCENVV